MGPNSAEEVVEIPNLAALLNIGEEEEVYGVSVVFGMPQLVLKQSFYQLYRLS